MTEQLSSELPKKKEDNTAFAAPRLFQCSFIENDGPKGNEVETNLPLILIPETPLNLLKSNETAHASTEIVFTPKVDYEGVRICCRHASGYDPSPYGGEFEQQLRADWADDTDAPMQGTLSSFKIYANGLFVNAAKATQERLELPSVYAHTVVSSEEFDADTKKDEVYRLSPDLFSFHPQKASWRIRSTTCVQGFLGCLGNTIKSPDVVYTIINDRRRNVSPSRPATSAESICEP